MLFHIQTEHPDTDHELILSNWKAHSILNTQYRKGVHILLSGLLHVLEVKAEERVTLCLVTENKIDCLWQHEHRKLPLMSAWQERQYNVLISLADGEFSHICRGPVHTFQGGQFCVEYSCAHPLQSISELMRCDAAPLSCRNWFLTRTDCIFSPPVFPLSVLSVFTIFPAVWLHLHDWLRRQAKGCLYFSTSLCSLWGISLVLESHTTLLRFPLFPSACPTVLVFIDAVSVPVFVRQREKKGGQLLSWCETVVSAPSSCLANLPWVSLAHSVSQHLTHSCAHTNQAAFYSTALCHGLCIMPLHICFSLYVYLSLTSFSAQIKPSFQAQCVFLFSHLTGEHLCSVYGSWHKCPCDWQHSILRQDRLGN